MERDLIISHFRAKMAPKAPKDGKKPAPKKIAGEFDNLPRSDSEQNWITTSCSFCKDI